ncbi:hypothetical protein B566_EDAN003496 [Ephemera danica]|nr:hypothetical protein B566_EDAN003496 [Ephemera danica]
MQSTGLVKFHWFNSLCGMKLDFFLFQGPGRLPIYRAESPSTGDGSGSSRGKCCCRPRRGVSLASALLTAAAALLALLLLLGAIAYFVLLADPGSEQEHVREITTTQPIHVSSDPPSSSTARTVSYATTPPRETTAGTDTVTPRSTSTSPRDDEEPLFKDVVVSYQPFQPPKSNGDVVTAGFVPHWFREELANTGEALKSPALLSQCLCDTGAIGATTARLEAAAGALGFAHVARGACRLAARQLLCALLEPPCQPDDRVLQPCRAACQAAVSECGEFLLATLGLGAEFDCSRYPDTRDVAQCVDLTGGISLFSLFLWRDTNVILADCDSPSVRCASSGACVPSQWRCDTRDDCSDSSDERSCRTFHAPTLRPSAVPVSSRATTPCRPGQARCLDGACIDASQLCDGLQHCSRGEDEAVCPPS